jgi:hypothetical protein
MRRCAVKKYYVIRQGWNAANQSALWRPANPKHDFESGRLMLLAVVDAESEEQAKAPFLDSCYHGQILFCETNPRAIKGLLSAVRQLSHSE